MWDWKYSMDYSPHLVLRNIREMFCGLLLIPQNIVMDLNNVMNLLLVHLLLIYSSFKIVMKYCHRWLKFGWKIIRFTFSVSGTTHAVYNHGHFAHETEGPWPLHFQALSLVEKAEPLQVRFTLRLTYRWSKWVQDGCDVYMESHQMASNGSRFMINRTVSKTTSWR